MYATSSARRVPKRQHLQSIFFFKEGGAVCYLIRAKRAGHSARMQVAPPRGVLGLLLRLCALQLLVYAALTY